jgi:hypothetical protein
MLAICLLIRWACLWVFNQEHPYKLSEQEQKNFEKFVLVA